MIAMEDWWARGIAIGSLVLSVLLAARQVLRERTRVRIHTHHGPRTGTDSGGRTVEAMFLWVTVINGARPLAVRRVAVVGKKGVREPEAWMDEFPLPMNPFDLKTLALCLDDDRDFRDAPGKREFIAAQDSSGRWWPRRRRLKLWWFTR